MPSQIITYDEKINYFVTENKPEIKQFSKDNFIEQTTLQSLDYGLTENTGLNNLDEPEPELTKEGEFEKAGNHIKEMMSKVKTAEQIEKDLENFDNDVNDKRKSLSFMNVKNETEGADWYRQNFSKLPDEFCEIMGRWNWGDLNEMTKKSVKNDKKKIAKGNKKTKEKYEFKKEEGNFVVSFD